MTTGIDQAHTQDLLPGRAAATSPGRIADYPDFEVKWEIRREAGQHGALIWRRSQQIGPGWTSDRRLAEPHGDGLARVVVGILDAMA